MEDRRRRDMGHGQLRSGDQPGVLGHRQRRPVDGGPAARRQPLHRVDHRDRRRDRPDQRPPSVQAERIVGLGRSLAADPGRLPAKRQDDQGTDQRRARRLPVVPRAHERQDQFRRRQAVREAERVQEPRSRDRTAGCRSRHESPAPARWPITARRFGAARTGRRSRSVRRPG